MTEEAPASCANCGKGEELEATLKACAACKLVKYCGRDCQIAHRPRHKKACKKRAAELHDEALFSHPPKGDDCPICFLTLPALETGCVFLACCGKMICAGCDLAHVRSNGSPACYFCRAKDLSAKEFIKQLEKRADLNDSTAVCQLGNYHWRGNDDFGVKKHIDHAVKLWHRAAELGSLKALNNLGVLFNHGCDGISKDKTKAKQYFEKGAMAGFADSRLILGGIEYDAGNFDRATKHWLNAASGGDIRAVNLIKNAMAGGGATKDDYAQAIRGYTQYLDDVRSESRDRAAAEDAKYKYLL
jgi:TPR repeat protein